MTELEETLYLELKTWLDENDRYEWTNRRVRKDREMYELLCGVYLALDKKLNPIPPDGGGVL